jgi:hypothetical protein
MREQIRNLFLILFVFCSFITRAQFDNEKYDKYFFLIGTLNEYMGYQRPLWREFATRAQYILNISTSPFVRNIQRHYYNVLDKPCNNSIL